MDACPRWTTRLPVFCGTTLTSEENLKRNFGGPTHILQKDSRVISIGNPELRDLLGCSEVTLVHDAP
eukprot:m.65007 g.65007  ORF g.65007 m.65007 type:complete len:67 (-) comp9735_c0_seq2:1290-1490(-)